MLLAIDIGNTSTAIGVYEGEKLAAHWRAATKKKATADELPLLFREFFEMAGYGFGQIKGVVVSNVVPSIQHAVASMCKRYFDRDPLCVTAENAGLKIDYPNPSEIGADRLADAVAAYERAKGAVIVVDFGTATTFDHVNEKGVYCGGAIAPGIMISNEALYTWTSKLPRVDVVKRNSVVGKSTVAAIQAGVYNGYVGLVRNILEKMKAEVGGSPKVIATGGLASLVVDELEIEVDRFLTLDGLKLIWQRNSLR